MKKIITVLSAIALGSTMVLAQPPMGQRPNGQRPQGGGRPGFEMSEQQRQQMQDMQDRMDPVKVSTKMADKLREELNLSQDQYDKVLKLYTSETKSVYNQLRAAASMGSGGMGMGGGMSAGGDNDGGEGMSAGEGAGEGGFGGGMGAAMGGGMGMRAMAGMDLSSMLNGGLIQYDDKTVKQRNKKMQKILNAEQYDKFLKIQEAEMIAEEERAQQMEERMQQMQSRMQQMQGRMQQGGGMRQGGMQGRPGGPGM